MRILLLLFICMICTLSTQAQETKQQPFHHWAPTPPMGWNSWDCYGPTVTEAEVKANAAYMAKHLKKSGWEYVVVDIRWYVANDKAHGYNQTDPIFSIDEFGRFIPATNRFPSAGEGRGFKPLADYIHSLGLKFGIHIMRGVPVIAVDKKLPVKGSGVTAGDIYSKDNQCSWLKDMYTIVPGQPGAQEYYNSIFELYAEWGVDFVKVDDLSSPIYFTEEVEMIRRGIDRTGRKIVLSTSPGETPIAHAGHVKAHANMWRTVGDFWDSWQQLKEHFAVFARWNEHRGPGAYPDGDMLPLGRLSIRGERGDDRWTAFTRDEQYTLMTLWTIFKSPMMFGGDLPSNDAFTKSLLTNRGMLYVLKNSTNNRELIRTEDMVVWVADDPVTGDKFVALFNTADPVKFRDDDALFSSSVQSTKSKKATSIDVALGKTSKLFLIASDGGDGIAWDHANWINPTIYSDNDSILLTDLRWEKASAEWGEVKVNGSVSGGKLNVAGIDYVNGFGTHSNSVIEFTIPDGFTRFKALAGIDGAAAHQNTGGTVKFMIYTKNPIGGEPPASATIKVNLNDLGLTGGVKVTNLWTGEKTGVFTSSFEADIPRHGAGLYRLSKEKSSKK